MASSNNDYVALKDLAAELGMGPSSMRRYVKRLDIPTERRRTPNSRNQTTLTVTLEDAEYIRNKRQSEGFTSDATVVSASDRGFFYIIQLVPELDPKRLKLGFAENVETGLSQHKTAAPTATVLKSWPCKRVWEKTVIDALTVRHCRLVANEVFECDSHENLVVLADNIFDILPDPQDTINLSEYSQLLRENDTDE